jgi:hypothetical protein
MSKLLALRETFKPTGSLMARVNHYGRDAIRTIAPLNETYNFPHFRQLPYGRQDEVSKWQADSEQVREAKEQEFLLKHAMSQENATEEVRKRREKTNLEMVEIQKRKNFAQIDEELENARLSEREQLKKREEEERLSKLYEIYKDDNNPEILENIKQTMRDFAMDEAVRNHPDIEERLHYLAHNYGDVIDQYNLANPSVQIERPDIHGMQRLMGHILENASAFGPAQELSSALIETERRMNDIRRGKMVWQMNPEVMSQLDSIEAEVQAKARQLAYRNTAEQEYKAYIEPAIPQIEQMEAHDEAERNEQQRLAAIERQDRESQRRIDQSRLDPDLPPNQGGRGPWEGRSTIPYPEGQYRFTLNSYEDGEIPEGYQHAINFTEGTDAYYPRDVIDAYLKERKAITTDYEEKIRKSQRALKVIADQNARKADSYEVGNDEYDTVDLWGQRVPVRNQNTKFPKDETDIKRIRLFTNHKLYSAARDLPHPDENPQAKRFNRKAQKALHWRDFTRGWGGPPRDRLDDQFQAFRIQKLQQNPHIDAYMGRVPELFDTDIQPLNRWQELKPRAVRFNRYVNNMRATALIPRRIRR